MGVRNTLIVRSGGLTDVEYNIIQGKLDNVVCNLLLDTPALDDLGNLGAGLLSNLRNPGVVWRIEGLEVLFLDASIQKLLVALHLSRAALRLLRGRRPARVSSLRRRSAVLALRRLSWWSALVIR